MGIVRSNRDEEILETLVFKVRLFTPAMIARTWWPEARSPEVHARRRLAQLVEVGLLESTRLFAEPMLALEQPVSSWRPGDPPPDAEAVSYTLQSRWTIPPVQTEVVVATKNAVYQYGGRGRGGQHQRFQAGHDLHLSAVYLHYCEHDPVLARDWLGEDFLGKAGDHIKDPDALIMGPDERPRLAIEFGGRYDARRVQEFHEHCQQQKLGYELW